MSWITDTLPPRAIPVLITVETRRKRRYVTKGTYWTRGPGHDGDDDWGIGSNNLDLKVGARVVAWQPLPEPFAPTTGKGGES